MAITDLQLRHWAGERWAGERFTVLNGLGKAFDASEELLLGIGHLAPAAGHDLAGDDEAALFVEGLPLLAVEYMAPEQAGLSRQVDVRADIYSLGSVLFHLLAGRLPFEDDSPVRRLAMRLEQRALRLSEFRPLARACPRGWHRISCRIRSGLAARLRSGRKSG